MKITFAIESGKPSKEEFNTAYNQLEGCLGNCSLQSVVYDAFPDLVAELDCDGACAEDMACEFQDAIEEAKTLLAEDFGISLEVGGISAQ